MENHETIILIISIGILLATKALDVYSTIRFVPSYAERNPIAQVLMKKLRLSFPNTIVVIMLIYFLIVLLSIPIALAMGSVGIWIFVICNLITSYYQVGAYYYNAKRKIIPGMGFILNCRWYN